MSGHYRPRFQDAYRCQWCQEEFLATRKDAKACSPKCRQAIKRATTGRVDRGFKGKPGRQRGGDDFDANWDGVHQSGCCQVRGSDQYWRIAAIWIAKGKPEPIYSFILNAVGMGSVSRKTYG